MDDVEEKKQSKRARISRGRGKCMDE